MCWSKRSSKHRRLKKPALSAPRGSPRTACSPPAPIRASVESVRAASVRPVSDPPAASWNVQTARAMATDPLTGIVRRAVTVTDLTHRVRIAQAGIVHRVVTVTGHSHRVRIDPQGIARRVVTVTGLRVAVVRPSNRVAAGLLVAESHLAADLRAVAADLRAADHPVVAVRPAVRARHGVILDRG